MTSPLVLVLSALSIIAVVVGTVWSVARAAPAASLMKLDSLAQQAQPLRKIELFGYYAVIAVVVASLVAFFIDDPKGASGLSAVLCLGILVACQWIRHLFQRVRALEEVVKRSVPEFYSQLKEERG